MMLKSLYRTLFPPLFNGQSLRVCKKAFSSFAHPNIQLKPWPFRSQFNLSSSCHMRLDKPVLLRICVRQKTTKPHESSTYARKKRHTSVVMYIAAIGITMLGGAYAGVPLYRMFCAATGLGGKSDLAHDTSGKIASLEKLDERVITVRFNADVASSMQWNFKPQQSEIKVCPGETALAFYTARNPTDKPIIGISTYSVIPYDAGQYFNKIQCFCFEEQILNPNEEVDMPVFFYIDPDFATDPRLERVNEITLSYTFFEAKDGMSLPLPGYAQKAH